MQTLQNIGNSPRFLAEKQQSKVMAGASFADYLQKNATAVETPMTRTSEVSAEDDTIEKLLGGLASADANFNWDSTGEHKLTSEQIQELKDKYDVNNLSDEDYYNLLADLTQMNAVSKGDLENINLDTFSGNLMIVAYGENAPFGNYSYDNSDSMVERLMQSYMRSSDTSDFMLSDDFWKYNSHFDYTDYSTALGNTNDRIESCEKLIEIFNSLK